MDKIGDFSRRTINYTIGLNEQKYSPLLGVSGRQPLAAHRQQDWREDDLAKRPVLAILASTLGHGKPGRLHQPAYLIGITEVYSIDGVEVSGRERWRARRWR